MLNDDRVPESERIEFRMMLQQGVSSLQALLEDLIVLSRLEAGHDQRNIAQFDAGTMLEELCAAMKPMATERNLFLESEGPSLFIVQGDAVKTQRIAQNLLLNAIKYTEQGRVKVGWGEVAPHAYERWMLYVQDTGPGFEDGSVTPSRKQSRHPRRKFRWSNRRPKKPGRIRPLLRPRPCSPPSRCTGLIIKRQAKGSAYQLLRSFVSC